MARELGIGCLHIPNGKKKIVFDGTVLIPEMKGQGRERKAAARRQTHTYLGHTLSNVAVS